MPDIADHNSGQSWGIEQEREWLVPGTDLVILSELFGALSQDPRSPLSRVSVANSCFSLDPFRGCPARCKYCTVVGARRDIDIVDDPNGQAIPIRVPTSPKQLFTGRELADALIDHPAFVPGKSVVSVGTGSTETFLPGVEAETWQVMKAFKERRLKNPFWFVIKVGFSKTVADKWVDRFSQVIEDGIPVVLSVSYAANPRWVEPYRGDRFQHVNRFTQVGVRVSHHLRPVIGGISDTIDCARTALTASLGVVDCICIGGLRRDPGVELAWKIHGLNPDLLPEYSRKKEISDEYHHNVRSLLDELGHDVPLFEKSSLALAYLLGIPDYNLYRYRPSDDDVFLAVPRVVQEEVARVNGRSVASHVTEVAQRIGLFNVHCTSRDEEEVRLNRPLSHQEHRALVHAIGHMSLLP